MRFQTIFYLSLSISLSSYLISFILSPFHLWGLSGLIFIFREMFYPVVFLFLYTSPIIFTKLSFSIRFPIFIFLPSRKRWEVMRRTPLHRTLTLIMRLSLSLLKRMTSFRSAGEVDARVCRVDYVFAFTLGWLDGLRQANHPCASTRQPTEKLWKRLLLVIKSHFGCLFLSTALQCRQPGIKIVCVCVGGAQACTTTTTTYRSPPLFVACQMDRTRTRHTVCRDGRISLFASFGITTAYTQYIRRIYDSMYPAICRRRIWWQGQFFARCTETPGARARRPANAAAAAAAAAALLGNGNQTCNTIEWCWDDAPALSKGRLHLSIQQ